MPDPNIDERKLAAGAAIMRDMEREERREQRHIESTRLSISSAAVSIAFVAIIKLAT